jgi:hypothetical protein
MPASTGLTVGSRLLAPLDPDPVAKGGRIIRRGLPGNFVQV